jgi:NTP pyrophosphatase (non-canonical NTP hydrolase)
MASLYGVADDRLYSNWDIFSNLERFTMWSLKGIRKGKIENDQHQKDPLISASSFSHIYSTSGLKFNLLISFAWLLALMNRLHIDLEEQVWQRFPYYCPYCGELPCNCKKWKIGPEIQALKKFPKPNKLEDTQKMFSQIYPASQRTLDHAGVHLAEELGELSEALHLLQGTHEKKYFQQIEKEAADYFSCLMGVANSADLDFSSEFYHLFPGHCHVCGQKQCVCNFF